MKVLAITTLVENTVYKPGLLAEHGLSLLIETSEGVILFDTGQGPAILSNAAAMGVTLGNVSAVVLSHGHYDHTGGLGRILGAIGPRRVCCHPMALGPKYSSRTGEIRRIGIPDTPEDLERLGAEFQPCNRPTEVLPGAFATGPIPRVAAFETVSPHFLTEPPGDGERIHDQLQDDQALFLDTDPAVLILGCSHSGVINSLLYVADLLGRRRFGLVIGGTHLIEASEERLGRTLQAFGEFDILRMAPCHCTGLRGQFALRQSLGERFLWNTTGDRIDCSRLDPV